MVTSVTKGGFLLKWNRFATRIPSDAVEVRWPERLRTAYAICRCPFMDIHVDSVLRGNFRSGRRTKLAMKNALHVHIRFTTC